MANGSTRRTVEVVAMTTVAVVAFYDVLLLWPATEWLISNQFEPFGSALPAPTQFMCDMHWILLGLVLGTHLAAALNVRRRFGVAACVCAVLLSGALTAAWFFAVTRPFVPFEII